MRFVLHVLVFWQLETDMRAMQDKMLRRMIYVPRSPTETPEAHMIRWSKLLHSSRAKHQILHGDEMYVESYFSWCCHVARLTKMDPTARKRAASFCCKIWNGCVI